jgi:4-amino-4-deoxy-L-arabinose transferase-like glycosyltransferase
MRCLQTLVAYWGREEGATADVTAILAVVLLAWIAMGTVLLATRSGCVVTHDSVLYLGSAEMLLSGQGLRSPLVSSPLPSSNSRHQLLTWYPPLYAISIAATSAARISPTFATRALNALSLGASVLSIFLLARPLKGPAGPATRWLPVLAAVSLPVNRHVFEAHGQVGTDALYLALLLMAAVSLKSCLLRPTPWRTFSAGLLLALGALTRYAGLFAAITAGLAVLILSTQGSRARAKQAATLVVIGVGPTLAFMLYGRFADAAPPRPIGFFPPGGWWVVDFCARGLALLVPVPDRVLVQHRWLSAVLAVVAASCLALAALRWRTLRDAGTSRSAEVVVRLSLLFTVAYPAFFVASRLFLDPMTPETRLLLPILPFALILFWNYLGLELRRRKRLGGRLGSIALLALAVAFTAGHGVGAVSRGVRLSAGQDGYDAVVYERSPLVQFVQELPAEVPVYSNAADLLYYRTKRRNLGWTHPNWFRPGSTAEAALSTLPSSHVLLAATDLPASRPAPEPSELDAVGWLQLVARFGDGAVYRVRESAERGSSPRSERPGLGKATSLDGVESRFEDGFPQRGR